jgi:hypothetical protein
VPRKESNEGRRDCAQNVGHSSCSQTRVRHVENDGSTDQERDNLNSISNRLELCGLGCRKAEIANDYGREAVENTIGDGSSEDGDKDQDGLGVPERHDSLLLVETLVLDTSLVSRNPLDCDKSLALVEEPGI